jgi:hypothetical protein
MKLTPQEQTQRRERSRIRGEFRQLQIDRELQLAFLEGRVFVIKRDPPSLDATRARLIRLIRNFARRSK